MVAWLGLGSYRVRVLSHCCERPVPASAIHGGEGCVSEGVALCTYVRHRTLAALLPPASAVSHAVTLPLVLSPYSHHAAALEAHIEEPCGRGNIPDVAGRRVRVRVRVRVSVSVRARARVRARVRLG